MEFPESDNRQNGFFFVASIPKPVKAGFFHKRTVSAHIPERLILRTSLRGVVPACFRPFNGEPQPAENATIAEAIEFGGRSLPAAAQLRVVAARPDTSFREARCRSALDPDCNYPTLPGCPTLEISVRLKISSRVSGRAGRLPIGRPATLAHSGRSPGRPTRMKNVRLIVCRVAASPESPPAKGCNLRFCPRWLGALTCKLKVRFLLLRFFRITGLHAQAKAGREIEKAQLFTLPSYLPEDTFRTPSGP